ncbi:DUF4153 domain-containing protein [Longispora urticae]
MTGSQGASRNLVWALLGTAFAVSVAVPLDRPGAGWLVGGMLAAGFVRYASGRWLPGRLRAGWALICLALLAVGGFRAAGWLFTLCVLGALLAGILAVADGRLHRLGLAALSPFAFTPLGLAWLARGFGRAAFRPNGRPLAVIGASAGLLVVFGALLASADAQFGELLTGWLPALEVGPVLRMGIVFWGALVALACAGYLVGREAGDLIGPEPADAVAAPPRAARLRTGEWAVPVGLLVVLFAAFVAVQLSALFGDQPAGVSFADNARGGFWQLSAVTVLTLALIGAVFRLAPRTDGVLLRLLLGGLAGLTLVIVASALHRMSLYQEAYGFTRLRLLVSACELWLGLVFVLVLGSLVRLRGGWLPRAMLATGLLALVGLAALNPDGFIAERNVTRYAATGDIDVEYLANLSADAAPALAELPPDRRACALRFVREELRDLPNDESWRGFNLGRHRAAESVRGEPGPCTWRELR